MSSQDNIIKFEEARRNVRSDRSVSSSRSRSQRSANSSRSRTSGRVASPSRGVTARRPSASASYGGAYDSRQDSARRAPRYSSQAQNPYRMTDSYDPRDPYNPHNGYQDVGYGSASYGENSYRDAGRRSTSYRDGGYRADSSYSAGPTRGSRAQGRQDRSLRNHEGRAQDYGYPAGHSYSAGYPADYPHQHPHSTTRRQHTYQDPFQGLCKEYRENYRPENAYTYDLGFDQEPLPDMAFDPYDPYHDDYGMEADVYFDDEPREPVEARFDRSKREERKREKTKKHAAKQFFKQFGSDKRGPEEGDPRAALYEYEMGAEHKRAYSQLSEHQEAKDRSRVQMPGEEHTPFYQRKFFKIVIGTLVVLFAIGAFLYPGAQQYYIEMRNHDRVQAEYDAVTERNEALQNDVNHLQTDEGIQDAARTDLGLVGEGENAVTVTDLPDDIESTSGTALHPQIPSGSVEAPETWYSKFLDPFFGYSDVAQV